MIQKEHAKLLRDIKRYINQLGESNIGFTEFFTESSYWSEQNKQLPCYQITRKGCEFIVNKITGRKGTEFTARYINRFHDMENIIAGQQSQKKTKTMVYQAISWQRYCFIQRLQGISRN